jgi:hypothetical protein
MRRSPKGGTHAPASSSTPRWALSAQEELRAARQRAEAAACEPGAVAAQAAGREDKEMPAGTCVHVSGRGLGARCAARLRALPFPAPSPPVPPPYPRPLPYPSLSLCPLPPIGLRGM